MVTTGNTELGSERKQGIEDDVGSQLKIMKREKWIWQRRGWTCFVCVGVFRVCGICRYTCSCRRGRIGVAPQEPFTLFLKNKSLTGPRTC